MNASQRDSSGPAPGPSGFAQDAGTEPNQPRLAGCVSNEQSELYVPEQLNADPLAALAELPIRAAKMTLRDPLAAMTFLSHYLGTLGLDIGQGINVQLAYRRILLKIEVSLPF